MLAVYTHLVWTVLSTFALEVAREVSMLTVLHYHHQRTCRTKGIRDDGVEMMGTRTCINRSTWRQKVMTLNNTAQLAGVKKNCLVHDSPPAFVHAPSRLTTLRWWPMWMRIFSSDIRARYSLEVAPSATPGNKGIIFMLGVGSLQWLCRDSKCASYLLTALLCALWSAACNRCVVSQTVQWNRAISADTAKLEAGVVAMNFYVE